MNLLLPVLLAGSLMGGPGRVSLREEGVCPGCPFPPEERINCNTRWEDETGCTTVQCSTPSGNLYNYTVCEDHTQMDLYQGGVACHVYWNIDTSGSHPRMYKTTSGDCN